MIKTRLRKSHKGTGLVKVDVGNGMFRGEKIVSFKIMGEDVSVIVNEKSVKSGGKLEVNIYEAKKGRVLIGLPGESFSTSRKVWVDRQELIA